MVVRQNTLLMVRHEVLAASPSLQAAHDATAGRTDLVHPRAYLPALAPPTSAGPAVPLQWLAMGPEIASATLRRWLGRADKV